ncbi:HAAS signaling domain-containing protein [Actinomadura rugatobispora]|uniref:ABC transporter permease n=1 Tax=Actinomadura rugatobispora TaxID=1994 RepID=A0ABW1AGH4_9ACTN|nr:permease prefix domain 1-containing protein [Actinomadura rugatobispora]
MNANTLTERYVHEVVRRIPSDQRDDIAEELRAVIADTVEARGATAREVLTEMGDPIHLAARYADRPLGLIGPGLYPAYARTLKVLLAGVLPVVVAVSMAVEVFDGGGVASAIGGGVGALLAVGAQMIAWLTAVFAVVERSRSLGRLFRGTEGWTPDDLPDAPQTEKAAGRGVLASAAVSTLLLALIVWQHVAEPYRTGGDRMPILDPALWSGWIWPILVGLAGTVLFELVRVAAHRWTVPLAAAYAAAEALFAFSLIWVLHRQALFNPDFLATVNDGKGWTVPEAFYTGTILVVLAISATEILGRFRDTRP